MMILFLGVLSLLWGEEELLLCWGRPGVWIMSWRKRIKYVLIKKNGMTTAWLALVSCQGSGGLEWAWWWKSQVLLVAIQWTWLGAYLLCTCAEESGIAIHSANLLLWLDNTYHINRFYVLTICASLAGKVQGWQTIIPDEILLWQIVFLTKCHGV